MEVRLFQAVNDKVILDRACQLVSNACSQLTSDFSPQVKWRASFWQVVGEGLDCKVDLNALFKVQRTSVQLDVLKFSRDF